MDLNFLNIPDDTEIIDIIVGEKEITKLADFYNFYFMRTCFEQVHHSLSTQDYITELTNYNFTITSIPK